MIRKKRIDKIKMMLKLKYNKFLLVFLLLLNVVQYKAQTLNLNQFGIEEGLPQSSIYTMVQDKEGSIWVGTMNGISKYNGLRFENFTKKNGLAENRVTASAKDVNGNIWIGHWSGGITYYDAATKIFKEILPNNIKLYKSINAILCDKKGVVWFATEGEGVLRYENKNFTQLTKKDGLLNNIVTSLVELPTGEVWIGTASGINTWSGSIGIYDGNLPSKNIKALLCEKSKKNIWVGSADAGLFKINISNNQLTQYTTAKGLANNHVKVIYETNNENIFIGTYGNGVSKYLPQLEANNFQGSYFQTISSVQGLSNDRVLSIIQDRENNIWIGTYLNLNQYFDEQFEIFGENEGLPNSLVWSIMQSKKGNIWIGTEDGLVEFLMEDVGSYSNVKNQTERYKFVRRTGKTGQVTNSCALYEDNKGNIWFSDFGKGLSRLSPNGSIKNYNIKSGLPVNEIYCIKGDKNGNVWEGTNNGGLLKYDSSTEKFTQYTVKDGLGSDQIYVLHCDSKNRLWIGNLSGALTMCDLSSGTPVFKTFSDKDGYPCKFTISIAEDNGGNIWLGGYDMGIYKYDGKSFKNYSTKEGLNSNTPFLLICDKKNNLWIGTGIGIDKFNIEDESIKHYEKEDGFLGIEINPNAVCKDNEGNLWFGSIIGLVKYNAKNEKTNTIEPITSISNPRINF